MSRGLGLRCASHSVLNTVVRNKHRRVRRKSHSGYGSLGANSIAVKLFAEWCRSCQHIVRPPMELKYDKLSTSRTVFNCGVGGPEGREQYARGLQGPAVPDYNLCTVLTVLLLRGFVSSNNG